MGFNFKNLFRKNDNTEIVKTVSGFYDRTEIDATDANWRIIIGQRSNGKSYSICKTILEDYFDSGKRAAYIRRYEEMITPKNIQTLFDPHISLIIAASNGEYNGVFYRAKEFHLCYYEEDGSITKKDPTPFCICRAVNTWETTKGADVGIINLICYDEFLSREGYLKDEFLAFCNLCSSIIRNRKDCVIYMLANTVSKYSPYWTEFGIEGVDKMKQGEIRVYSYSKSKMKLAIEYCAASDTTKEVNENFFAFENAQLQVIQNGQWEMASYPHAPYKIFDDDIRYRFYVYFAGQLFQGQIVHPTTGSQRKDLFIFFCRQTKDIEINDKTVLYSTEPTLSICHCRYLNDTPTELHKLIKNLILKNHMYFADNEVGEIIRSWLIDQGIKGIL